MAGGGNTFAVLQGIGYWAPLGTLIPGPHLAYGDAYPSGWLPIVDTVNGYQVTFRNPRAAITSEERGRIGQVPAGDEGTAIALQYRSIDFDLLKRISALQSRTLAARSELRDLTFSAGVTTNGTVTLVLNGVTYTAAVTTTQSTPTLLATFLATPSNWSPSLPTTGTTGWTLSNPSAGVLRFTAAATGSRNGTYSYSPAATGSAATFGTTPTRGIAETEVAELDKNVSMGFMLAIEGRATAGSFFLNRRWIRYVFYNVENTANADHILRHSGADAAFAPSATLEALPAVTYTSTMLTGSGLVAADLDKNKRGNFFAIDAPEP